MVDSFQTWVYVNVQTRTGETHVIYRLIEADKNKEILNVRSSIICFDTLGREVFRLHDGPGMVNSTLMSSNKRYYLITTGGILGEGFQRLGHSSFQIYETKTGKMIFEDFVPGFDDEYGSLRQSQNSPYIIWTGVRVRYPSPEIASISQVFDQENLEVCKFTFTRKQYDRIWNEKILFSVNNWLHYFPHDCQNIQ